MRSAKVLALLALATGCVWGGRNAQLVPAHAAGGDTVTVSLYRIRRDLRGELFAVDDSGVILAAGQVTWVPWTRISMLRSRGLHKSFLPAGKAPPPAALDELALISRFPLGLNDSTLAAVLAAKHQDVLRQIE